MATYNTITTLKEIVTTTPADAEAASNLAAAVRQVKSFLLTYLAVSHSDGGELSADSVGSNQVLDGSIPGSAISGNLTGDQIKAGEIDSWHLASNAVLTAALKDLQVTAAKLASDAVETAKIADDAVTGAKIADNSIALVHMTDNSISDDEISGVSGSKLEAGTVTPTKLSEDATLGANLGLYVGTATASGNKLAQIGGVLTATIAAGTPNVLKFAFASGAASSTGVAIFDQRVSGTITAATFADRGPWNRVSGETVSEVSGNDIKILQAGTYLVHFSGNGYSCDEHQSKLQVGGADKSFGSIESAPVGAQTASTGWITLALNIDDLLTVQSASAAVTVATYGQGYAGVLANARFGHVILIKLN